MFTILWIMPGKFIKLTWSLPGKAKKKVVFLGMNPGPFGMAQTGVPFGEIPAVRDWMGLRGKVGKPDLEHAKRPVEGLDCQKSEVSGRRYGDCLPSVLNRPKPFLRITLWPIIALLYLWRIRDETAPRTSYRQMNGKNWKKYAISIFRESGGNS